MRQKLTRTVFSVTAWNFNAKFLHICLVIIYIHVGINSTVSQNYQHCSVANWWKPGYACVYYVKAAHKVRSSALLGKHHYSTELRSNFGEKLRVTLRLLAQIAFQSYAFRMQLYNAINFSWPSLSFANITILLLPCKLKLICVYKKTKTLPFWK